MAASPDPRDQRSRELTSRDEPHNEGAEAKAFMHMERKHRHSQADDEERYEDHPHDGDQSGDRALRSSLYVHGTRS